MVLNIFIIVNLYKGIVMYALKSLIVFVVIFGGLSLIITYIFDKVKNNKY